MVNNGSSIVESVYNSIFNAKPITAIAIVEDPKKVPENYTVINRTFDQDQDADLWRDSNFLKRRNTRYLCISRKPAETGLVIDQIKVISEKELAPPGYSCLYRALDSGQKAWRKKQLCFRFNKKETTKAITDIIVCYRTLTSPDNFHLSGNLNGLYIYYKMGNTQTSEPSTPVTALYPHISGNGDNENIPSLNEANDQPVQNNLQKTGTTGSQIFGLEGVKFDLSNQIKYLLSENKVKIPKIKERTLEDLDNEYNYDFQLEKDVLMNFNN